MPLKLSFAPSKPDLETPPKPRRGDFAPNRTLVLRQWPALPLPRRVQLQQACLHLLPGEEERPVTPLVRTPCPGTAAHEDALPERLVPSFPGARLNPSAAGLGGHPAHPAG